MKRTLKWLAIVTAVAGWFSYVCLRYSDKNTINQLSLEVEVLRNHIQSKDELISNLVEISDKATDESSTYIISHFPRAGEPWTVEKYWRQSEIWVALVSYSSRTAAEDVKVRLESGELKVRDLFR